MRILHVLFVAIVICGLALSVAFSRCAAAQGAWSVVPCTDAPLVGPFATKEECRQGPDDGGSSNNCVFKRWSIGGGDTSHGYQLFLYKTVFPKCWVRAPSDMAEMLKNNDPVTKSSGTSFMAVRDVAGSSISIFGVIYKGQPIQCFSFYKPGAQAGAGYTHVLTGHVCNRDGAPVTDAELQQVVSTIRTN